MTQRPLFPYFKTSPEIIRLAVMLYVRYPLSLRNVEDLPHERGIVICHETVRFWSHRCGRGFASEIRRRRADLVRSLPQLMLRWKRHLPRTRLSSSQNNRADHAHLPLQRRERAILRCRPMQTLQKFAAVHASVPHPFNTERHPNSPQSFKTNRDAALVKRRCLCAA